MTTTSQGHSRPTNRLIPRNIDFKTNINPYALASVLACYGKTQVHITVSMEESVPSFLKNKGEGWLTAEYSMLPGATHQRSNRERKGLSGRTQEIQRLIGRSLRLCLDRKLLGERTLLIDCDVLVADGGTRTTSISGAFVALSLAVSKLVKEEKILKNPILFPVGAISVGISPQKNFLVDLNYEEDSSCDVDMNIVMAKDGRLIEIQGTAEQSPFSYDDLTQLLKFAHEGLQVVFKAQEKALAQVLE